MHAPEFRDSRLGGDTIGRLDQLAIAEAFGRESASLSDALIEELSSLSPFRIAALERATRDAHRYAPDHAPKREPGVAGRMRRLFVSEQTPARVPPSRSGQWFRLMHPDGYIREATLKEIDEPPPAPIFLGALLLCLNDHVPQVRTAASQCFRRLDGFIPATVIADTVPYLVTRQFTWWNVEDRQAIDALLAPAEVRIAIKSLLMTSLAAWLPRFFRDLLASDIADSWLIELATGARHPAIRARSILVLVEGRVDRLPAFRSRWRDRLHNPERPVDVSFDIAALIAAGARDRTVKVRKAAMEGLVRHHRTLPDVDRLLEAFDNGGNAAVRDRVDFIRRQLRAG